MREGREGNNYVNSRKVVIAYFTMGWGWSPDQSAFGKTFHKWRYKKVKGTGKAGTSLRGKKSSRVMKEQSQNDILIWGFRGRQIRKA